MALSFLKRRLAGLLCAALVAGPSLAQDFTPRLIVNDRVITQFEVDQRAEFLKVLRSPGDLEEEALKGLIEDRLRQSEAERLELTVTPDEVKEGMEEFAQRANLTADQLIAELDKVGIAAETFRDFVSAGLYWRKAVRARFQGLVPITENDVDLALEAATRPGRLRVLVSELVIPVPEGEDGAAQLELATSLADTIRSEAAFAAAAQEYSAAPTASDGGRLDWMPLSNLPGAIGAAVLALGPGEVAEPLAVPGAVVLFMLRDLALDSSGEPIRVAVEWAEFLVPNDPEEIARLRAAVDVCYDLNAQAKGLPADRLTVTTMPASEIPGDVALELSRLDLGESSVALTRGGFRRFLMLCGREELREEPLSRDQVRERVIGQKVEGMSQAYLEELRSAAIIREP
jgi:peptidyl-prolyl cis-trans isomerase SurA